MKAMEGCPDVLTVCDRAARLAILFSGGIDCTFLAHLTTE